MSTITITQAVPHPSFSDSHRYTVRCKSYLGRNWVFPHLEEHKLFGWLRHLLTLNCVIVSVSRERDSILGG